MGGGACRRIWIGGGKKLEPAEGFGDDPVSRLPRAWRTANLPSC